MVKHHMQHVAIEIPRQDALMYVLEGPWVRHVASEEIVNLIFTTHFVILTKLGYLGRNTS